MMIIPPERIGGHMEFQINQLLRAVVLEADSRAKLGSPIDTGRFRSDWQIGEHAPDGKPNIDGSFPKGITPPRGSNYPAGFAEKIGNVYHIHNNLPYAEALSGTGQGVPASWKAIGRTGSDQQSGPWVDKIAKELEDWSVQEYQKILRRT